MARGAEMRKGTTTPEHRARCDLILDMLEDSGPMLKPEICAITGDTMFAMTSVLDKMRKRGEITCIGRNNYAFWCRVEDKDRAMKLAREVRSMSRQRKADLDHQRRVEKNRQLDEWADHPPVIRWVSEYQVEKTGPASVWELAA